MDMDAARKINGRSQKAVPTIGDTLGTAREFGLYSVVGRPDILPCYGAPRQMCRILSEEFAHLLDVLLTSADGFVQSLT